CKCATRLRHAPTEVASLAISRRSGYPAPRNSAAQQLQDVLELGADLTDDLLALARVVARFIAHETLPRTADREPFLVEKATDLADDQHVLTLVVTAIAAAFDGLQLGEFLLPVPQHVRFDRAELADFTDR